MPGPRQRHQNSESGRANQRAHEERIARRAAEREATQQVRGRGRGQQQEDRGQRQQDIPSGRGQDHQQQGYLQDQGRGRQQRDQGHQQQGFQPSQGQGQYPDSGCSQAAPDVTLSPRSSPPFPSPVDIGPSAPDQYLYPGTPFQVLNPSYTQRPLPEPASAPRQLPKTPPPPVVAFSPGTEAVSRSFDVPK